MWYLLFHSVVIEIPHVFSCPLHASLARHGERQTQDKRCCSIYLEHKLRYKSFLSCAIRMKKPLRVQTEGWPYICHIFLLRKGLSCLKPGRGGIYVLTSKTEIPLSSPGGFQTLPDFGCQYKSSPDILNCADTRELFSLKKLKLPNMQFRCQLSWDPKNMFLCLSSPRAGLSTLKIPTKEL